MNHVLKAFSAGIDGVFIGGCRFNECNYATHGNYHALNMVLLGKRLIKHIGLNPERLRLEVMSGSEGNLFAEVVDDFVRRIRALGPIGNGEGLEEGRWKAGLAETTKLVPYIKLTMREKLASRQENPEEWDALFTDEEIEELFRHVPAYYIDPAKCQACMTCARRCPAGAIISAKNQIHVIDQEKCIKCGTCLDACPPRFGAVRKIVGEPVPPPLPEGERTIVRKNKEVSNL